MPVRRREFLKLLAAGTVSAAHPGRIRAQKKQPEPIQLTLQQQRENWFGDEYAPVSLWGADRRVLRLRQHQAVEIQVHNLLPDETSIHWHGMRVPNAMDGVSGITQDPIASGGRFDYGFTPLDAGTFWAHAHHKTYEQLARGLYLPVIVEEDTPYPADQDLLLVLDDWRINRERQIDTASFGSLHDWAHNGRLGNLITVNRQRYPQLPVKAGQRLRLRILNAANSRIMVIQFPELPFWLLAKDGQPFAEPASQDSVLVLAPAERYDVILDIPGDWKDDIPIHEVSGEETIRIANMPLDAESVGSSRAERPPPLPRNPLVAPSRQTADHKVRLEMEGGAMGNLRDAKYKGKLLTRKELIAQKQVWTMNGVASLPEKPLLRASRGEIVEIEMVNNTGWPHAMHLHGHHFQVNSSHYKDDIWHDTVLMARGDTTSMRFQAGEPGRWLLHCHMIEHQISGMVTWIEVSA